MKKLIAFLAVIVFVSCENKKSADGPPEEAKPSVPSNTSGFTAGYSFSFVMDPATNTEVVLALWKDWKDGDISKNRSHFADSLTLILSDGSVMTGNTDELLKNMQEYRNSYKSIDVAVNTAFAVKSTDKDAHWVSIWGTEIQTDNAGKVDSVSLNETWRFNKEGKVDRMLQYLRKGITPPPTK